MKKKCESQITLQHARAGLGCWYHTVGTGDPKMGVAYAVPGSLRAPLESYLQKQIVLFGKKYHRRVSI